MSKYIYLAGGISGLSLEEQNGWRTRFENFAVNCDLFNKVSIFNPVSHIEELNPDKMDERQAMEYDLSMLRRSDLVIMNFNNPGSIGTACELGIAYEKRIPVLGINIDNKELHEWQQLMCHKIFTNWDSMIIYFINHYYNEW